MKTLTTPGRVLYAIAVGLAYGILWEPVVSLLRYPA